MQLCRADPHMVYDNDRRIDIGGQMPQQSHISVQPAGGPADAHNRKIWPRVNTTHVVHGVITPGRGFCAGVRRQARRGMAKKRAFSHSAARPALRP